MGRRPALRRQCRCCRAPAPGQPELPEPGQGRRYPGAHVAPLRQQQRQGTTTLGPVLPAQGAEHRRYLVLRRGKQQLRLILLAAD